MLTKLAEPVEVQHLTKSYQGALERIIARDQSTHSHAGFHKRGIQCTRHDEEL
jgi:hypothetical protein